ncbi:MAG: class I SAM-dependent methyltransferase [Planctomycetota bacterium]
MKISAYSCRSCGCTSCETILDLGKTPLANALVDPAKAGTPCATFPLRLVLCPECALVQIDEEVPPEAMFSDYPYFSSFSDTMLQHAADLASRMIAKKNLGSDSLVIEPASNDGYLLKNYAGAGVPVLGVEPASNIAEVAQANGVETLNEFFSEDLAKQLVADGKRADVMHAHNVVAHVPDLNGFIAGVAALLKPDGVFILEAPYARDMIDGVEFDTIYHEHFCYFSMTALSALFERHGLEVVHVERTPIHGGSLQVHTSPKGNPVDETVAALLAEEKELGMDKLDYYRDFAQRVEELRDTLVPMLNGLKAKGHSIAAYGASAKGSTLMNYMGIDGQQLDFIADRSTHKQGKLAPGNHLPIVAPEVLTEKQPDYTLLLTWNFAEEILKQQQAYRDAGGKFIVPVPSPTIR